MSWFPLNFKISLIFLVLFLFYQNNTLAQWSDSPNIVNSISTASELQRDIAVSTDSLGNSYYLWVDYRNNKTELYTQKLNILGVPEWTKDGILVGVISDKYNLNLRLTPKIIKPDGKGGALILWHYFNENDINGLRSLRFQRILADGRLMYSEDNQKIERGSLFKSLKSSSLDVIMLKNETIRLVYDYISFKGKLITKMDYDMNLKKFNSNISFGTNESNAGDGKLIARDSSFFVFIEDWNKDKFESYFFKLFFNYDGSKLYEEVSKFYSNVIFLRKEGTVSYDYFNDDKFGNVYIGRTVTIGKEKRIYVHKIGADGKLLWGNGGYNLGDNNSSNVKIVPLDDGGGIITWNREILPTPEFKIARFKSDGTILWQKDVVKSVNGLIIPNKIVSDGNNGIFTVWFTDKGNGDFNYTIQRIDKDGNLVFGENGKVIGTWNGIADYNLLALPKQGCITILGTATDKNELKTFDLFTNRVNNDGTLGIQNTISFDNVTLKQFNVGENINIKLLTSGDGFLKDNKFSISLIDAQGSERILGTSENGLVNVKIPIDIKTGQYLLKASSSSPKSQSLPLEISIDILPPVISVNQNVLCSGDSVTISTQGCYGTLKWMDEKLSGADLIISPAKTVDVYATCVVNDKESAKSNNLTLNVIEKPIAMASNSGPYYEGDDIKLIASGGVDYEWKGPNNFFSSSQNPILSKASLQQAGIYRVTVSNKTPTIVCSSSSTTDVKINPILSVDMNSISINKIYPNPSKSLITINIQEKFSVLIFNTSGVLVKQQSNILNNSVDISDLQKGNYIIKVQSLNRNFSSIINVE